jgi:hypothetical protein
MKRKLNEQQRANVCRLYRIGQCTVKELAELHQVGETTITRALEAGGVKRRKGGRRQGTAAPAKPEQPAATKQQDADDTGVTIIDDTIEQLSSCIEAEVITMVFSSMRRATDSFAGRLERILDRRGLSTESR